VIYPLQFRDRSFGGAERLAKELHLLLRSVKYGLYAAVLAGVVGGTVAWHSVDKTVALTVDGQLANVHTTADHVGEVLQGAGYLVGPHDIVAPSTNVTVRDGSRIVLQRGRLLHLDVNGVQRDIWTTAPTVAAALNQLGFSTADFTSVSRSKRLSLTPTDLSVRTPRFVSIVHDRILQQVTTTDSTVGQLLADLNVAVGPNDTVSVPIASTIMPGARIVVGRVTHSMMVTNRPLPYPTTQQAASSLSAGQTTVLTPGKDGLAQVTYAVVLVDGTVVGKTPVKTVVVQAPTAQVVGVGGGSPTVTAGAGGTGHCAGPRRAAGLGQWGVLLPGDALGPRERMAGGCRQFQRRLRDTPGAARRQDGIGRPELAERCQDPDPVGTGLYRRPLQHPVPGVVAVAGKRWLVLRCAASAQLCSVGPVSWEASQFVGDCVGS
jgi:uncharacterized protein YabE (DUF348 family)